jgi:tetratricopeptide (TPR) repeat protein
MRLARRLAPACLVLGGLVGALAVDGHASEPEAGQTPALDPTASERERELLRKLDAEELLTARREAEALLAEDPSSVVGHYVLGRVLHVAEGSLPQAMRELARARELYEARYAPGSDAPNWRLHQQILDSTAWLALEMEEFEFQLQILDYHDALYTPMSAGEHAWPLLRLGRVDRAREYAAIAQKSKQAWQRVLGHNAQCAIEGETQQREAHFKACIAAFDHKRALPAKDPARATLAIDASNAALAARSVLRPDEAEKLLLEGARHFSPTMANPWRMLVELRLTAGRSGDALDALREMQAWRRRTPANVRGQERAKTDAVAVTVFLLANEVDRGMVLADGILAAPDRRGLTTVSPMQALGGHALLRRVLRRAQRELDAERLSFGEPRIEGRLARLGARLEGFALDRADAERIVKAVSSPRVLVSTLRPYVAGGLDDVPTWLVGELVEAIGPGIVAAAIDEARADDPGESTRAYFDAYEAEAALAKGDEERALALARRALDGLPATEALLRARTAAIAYQAALDQDEDALGYLEQALSLDGGIFRRLGLAIPARLELPDDDVGRALRAQLEASPRLDVGGAGVAIRLAPGPDEAVCVHGPTSGAPILCGRVPAAREGENRSSEAEARAQRLARALHVDAFAVPLGLSGTDVSSLDGSTTTSEEAVREKLQRLLERDPDVGQPE